jgi:hypothetical protein
MKRLSTLAFLSLVAFSGFLAAQDQPENPSFSLELKELKPQGYSGKDIWITIVMTNISEQVIDCSSFLETNTLNHSFLYDVRDGQGSLAEKQVLSRSHPEIGAAGSSYPCSLEPGKSKKWDVAINGAFHLDHAGDYTVQVSRLAGLKPADGYIKSNIITVTVLPSESKPSAETAPREEKQTSENEPDSQASQQPFVIQIHANQPQVAAGDPVDINLTMSNFSDHPIDCTAEDSQNIDMNYQYEVLDEDGISAPKLERKVPSETVPCTLMPANSRYFSALLSQLYDFSVPGKYTVQVSRPVWGDEQRPGTGRTVKDEDAIVRSNKITINVLPPGSKPTEDNSTPAQQ